MIHTRTPRRRLAAAVVAVLAATGTGLTAPAAAVGAPAAAPSAAPATATAPAVVPYPVGRADLVGAGTTGFMTWTLDDRGHHAVWTRYSDGRRQEPWPGDDLVTVAHASDVAVRVTPDEYVTLRDMTTDQDVLSFSSGVAGRDGRYVGAVGRTAFVKVPHASGGHDVHLLSRGDGGVLADRTVTGLPKDARDPVVRQGTSDTALLTYLTGTGAGARRHWATVDLATAALTKTAPLPGAPDRQPSIALSGGHVAWLESGAGGAATAVVTERGPATGTRRIALPAGVDSVGLAGDWLTYAQSRGYEERNPSPAYAVTARHLGNGTTRKLMDDMTLSAVAPDGALVVQGGTIDGGEGLYRIVPGTGGVPAVTRVASSGLSTKVTLLGHDVPKVVDLDRTGGRFTMVWRLSRSEVEMRVKIRNTRTGETLSDDVLPLDVPEYDPHAAPYTWEGRLAWNGTRDLWTGASDGPYTWEITAKPLNGIGPELRSSGSFTATRKPGLHDYDADGSPDVLSRDAAGRLWIGDTLFSPYADRLDQNPGLLVGGGWQVYDRIEAAGNLGGSAVSDVVARDRSGALWLYRGTGDGRAPLGGRTWIGGGWGTYDTFTGGSDLTGDGRPDLVAADRTGVLWLHPATGDTSAPFGARKRIGGGWGAYNQLTATGNIGGGTAGDLVARDKDGVLWLYLGRGDGTFAPRARIGGGWNAYGHLVGIGDADRDGRPDLYASRTDGNPANVVLYKGTGDWKQPFRPASTVSVYSTTGNDPARNLYL
ncbi:FG-GAP repeat domain-containing protein [Streptomyces sp. NPDC090056]|uniref:FG-GAP repeat domain-containing protein n=1 Tax=Streptomyces sp. NPDC090056 TaxID=3365934 RepID=UPI00380A5999